MYPNNHMRSRAHSPQLRLHTVTWLIALSLSLAGCASGLGSRHRALQAELGAQEPSRPGPVVAEVYLGGPTLARRELIREVLKRNPTVRSAEYAFRAALARYPQSTALDDPQLAYGLAPRSLGSNSVNDAHKIEVRQRLPFPGKLRLRGEETLARADAEKHNLASIRLELATVASVLLDDYYYLGRAIEINDEHLELLERFKAVATARYQAGQGSQQDPLQAETELAHVLHQGVVLRTNIELVAQRMNVLLRRSPYDELPGPPSTLSLVGIPRSTVASEELALEHRPELRAATSRVEAETASVAHAWREFFPDFTLAGAYNTLWQEEDLQPFVGISINVPLQIGRRRAAVREAQANLGRAQAERERVSDDIRLSVAQARARLSEAKHVVTLFGDRLLPPAKDRVAAARAGFESGRNSFLALIDAERNLRTTAVGLEKARAERSQARAEFLRAVGLLATDTPEDWNQ